MIKFKKKMMTQESCSFESNTVVNTTTSGEYGAIKQIASTGIIPKRSKKKNLIKNLILFVVAIMMLISGHVDARQPKATWQNQPAASIVRTPISVDLESEPHKDDYEKKHLKNVYKSDHRRPFKQEWPTSQQVSEDTRPKRSLKGDLVGPDVGPDDGRDVGPDDGKGGDTMDIDACTAGLPINANLDTRIAACCASELLGDSANFYAQAYYECACNYLDAADLQVLYIANC